MPPKLICIIGPDGSGKTTQAHLLINNLKNIGLNYEYKWLRFNHFFSLPILGIARLIGLSEMKTLENDQKIGYHYFYKSKIISWFYIASLFFDTLIFTIIKVYIPIKILGRNIVSDRFIYDTIIDLKISTGNKLNYNKLEDLFLFLIPNDIITIQLIADEKVLKSRRNDVFLDKCLEMKIVLYEKLFEKTKDIIIDTSQMSSEKVHQKIIDEITKVKH